MCHVIIPWEPPLLWRHTLWRHALWRHTLWRHTLWRHTLWRRALWCHALWRHTQWRLWACDHNDHAVCGFPHENSCQTPIKLEWNAEVRTLRFALTEKSCNLIGPFVPRDLYTRRWLATGRSDSPYYSGEKCVNVHASLYWYTCCSGFQGIKIFRMR